MLASDAHPPRSLAADTPLAYVIEPSLALLPDLTATLVASGFRVCVSQAGVPELTGVGLVVVEADRGARTIALVRRLRAMRAGIPAVGVLRWWNEDERDLLPLADMVLHVPLRQDQLAGFRRFATTIATASTALTA